MASPRQVPQRPVREAVPGASARGPRRKPQAPAPVPSRQPAAETAMAAAFSRLLKRS